MEPSLKNGDVLVVRKSDGIWQRQTRKNEDPFLTSQRLQQYELEYTHCNASAPSLLVNKPPMPIVGDIVVYKDPTEYPWRYCIKRIVGLGQQIVMMPSNRYLQKPSNLVSNVNREGVDPVEIAPMRVASPSVPPYSVWVEGDNFTNSKDSATHGPLSKKLLVGIAEYRIWPPTRIGKLGEETDLRSDPKPYSFWP